MTKFESIDNSVYQLNCPILGSAAFKKLYILGLVCFFKLSWSFFAQTTTAEQLLEFFKQVGDVKFVRMAGDETQPTRFAFVEFVEQESVARALTLNGVMFGDRPLKYVFS